MSSGSLKWVGMLGVAGMLAWPLPVQGAKDAAVSPAQAERSEAERESPSAREILERFSKLVGGEEAFAKIRSQHATGRFEIKGQEVKGAIEIFASQPNRLVMHIDVPGLMKMSTGFDGKTGWSSNPLTGPMLLKDKALDAIVTQSDFEGALHRMDQFKIVEKLGKTEFEGESCFKIRLVYKNGVEITEYYGEQSGLVLGFESTQDTPLGAVKVVSNLGDYKKFGDILMPAKISQELFGMRQIIWVDDVKFNTVPDSVYELPADVKALVAE